MPESANRFIELNLHLEHILHLEFSKQAKIAMRGQLCGWGSLQCAIQLVSPPTKSVKAFARMSMYQELQLPSQPGCAYRWLFQYSVPREDDLSSVRPPSDRSRIHNWWSFIMILIQLEHWERWKARLSAPKMYLLSQFVRNALSLASNFGCWQEIL
jgi:hypothetical protein